MGARELDLLWRYYGLLRARNPDRGLLGAESFRDIALKHFLDCAVVPTMVALPSPLLDIGAGAGFPGIVLAILVPGLHVVLAEERTWKADFLQEAIHALGLHNAQVYPSHVGPGARFSVRAVITRALERIAATLRRCEGFLTPGAQVIFMKGPAVDSELREVARRVKGTYVLRRDLAYVLGGTPYRRRLLVYERVA